eukprot:Gregarina_sp_Poly_1__10774@NODE_826_length_6116_cov_38_033229_g598_i0_p5_GENE_NODE_826_length_6116_cov_38_033229_g598_i0NODE_826_length_6116_cov_38_033229_g598_i0_p5_ORF_typecomplete_len111_score15_36_NODE_826_length_6116_cov_38_033229_g598_i033863718
MEFFNQQQTSSDKRRQVCLPCQSCVSRFLINAETNKCISGGTSAETSGADLSGANSSPGRRMPRELHQNRLQGRECVSAEKSQSGQLLYPRDSVEVDAPVSGELSKEEAK